MAINPDRECRVAAYRRISTNGQLQLFGARFLDQDRAVTGLFQDDRIFKVLIARPFIDVLESKRNAIKFHLAFRYRLAPALYQHQNESPAFSASQQPASPSSQASQDFFHHHNLDSS